MKITLILIAIKTLSYKKNCDYNASGLAFDLKKSLSNKINTSIVKYFFYLQKNKIIYYLPLLNIRHNQKLYKTKHYTQYRKQIYTIYLLNILNQQKFQFFIFSHRYKHGRSHRIGPSPITSVKLNTLLQIIITYTYLRSCIRLRPSQVCVLRLEWPI